MRWLDNITDSAGMNLWKLQEIMMDRGAFWAKFMVSQRVGHNLVSEQLLTDVYKNVF